MKNSKLKVASVLVAGSFFIPVVSAHAEGTTSGSNFGAGLIKQQQNIEQRQEWNQYKGTVAPKKDTLKQNNQTISSLRKEVSQKKANAKEIIKSIKQSNKQLTSDDLSKIQTELKSINDEINSLTATKNTIKDDFQTVRTDVKSKNFQDAEAKLDNAISIQNTRIETLKKISTDMDTLLSLLQSASSNAKTL